jgi:hypothetical protein
MDKIIYSELGNNANLVGLNEKIYTICEKFAEQVNPTTKYSDCNQNNIKKKLLDNLVGKLGEFGCYCILKEVASKYNWLLELPDTKIYKGTKKNWRSDLIISDGITTVNFAVKTQLLSQAKKYGFSGTFQCAEFRRDTVLQRPDEFVFLCMVDDSRSLKSANVLIMPVKQVKDIKLSDPKLIKLKGYKKCYYARENFDNECLKRWFVDLNIQLDNL